MGNVVAITGYRSRLAKVVLGLDIMRLQWTGCLLVCGRPCQVSQKGGEEEEAAEEHGVAE